MIKNIDVSFSIDSLASGDFKNLNKLILPPNNKYTLIISYPIRDKEKFTFNTGKNGMCVFAVLNKIGSIYNKIYKNEEKYGVWGHCIGDLYLEGIMIDTDKK